MAAFDIRAGWPACVASHCWFAYDEGNSEVQGWLATFRDGLAKLGWIEGQNLHFEFRFTGSDTTLMEKAVKGIIVGVHDRQSVSHV
jgi:hypothetical protein